jgi:hypothetical protein
MYLPNESPHASPVDDGLTLDLRNVAFCITGFSGPDLLHVEQLILLMGGDYYSTLTRKRSLLLTTDNQLGGPKLVKAKEWGIPVINIGWFWNVIARAEEADITPWCDQPVGILPCPLVSDHSGTGEIYPRRSM